MKNTEDLVKIYNKIEGELEKGKESGNVELSKRHMEALMSQISNEIRRNQLGFYFNYEDQPEIIDGENVLETLRNNFMLFKEIEEFRISGEGGKQ